MGGKVIKQVPHPMPLWFRLAYLGLAVALVPVYAIHYPWVNFFWFSNLALLGGLVAAWTSSSRLASALLVCVGLLELGWIVDFLGGLVLMGQAPFGMVDYMFDPEIPLLVRALSLYHLVLPFALWWMVWRLGYDARAWRWLVPAGWGVVLITRLTVDEGQNVNWVLSMPWLEPGRIHEGLWLLLLMLGLGIAWWVTHRLVLWFMQRHE